ncbi:MAG: AEC family transporter [Oscillospiraceae bacterium]|nr:AEC family transporter [Oscillospiraceae bacterium]
MALTLALAHKIAGMAIQIFLGFLVIRLGVMKFEDSKILSSFALYVVTPCAMLDAFQYPFSPDKLSGMGVSLLASLLAVGIFALLGLLARRLLHWNAVETCSLEYPNAGNFMIPLVISFLGGEGLIYLSPCLILMNLLLFTHCQGVLSGIKKFSFSVFYKNIVLVAVVIGFVMFLKDWRLPGILGETVSAFSAMLGPIYMFTIGMILGNADLKKVFTNRRAYVVSLGRLLLCPLLVMLPLLALGLSRIHPQGREILTVVVLTAGAPTAVLVTQFAQLYRSEQEAQFASSVNVMSTLLCLLTMPAVSWLYQGLVYGFGS